MSFNDAAIVSITRNDYRNHRYNEKFLFKKVNYYNFFLNIKDE